MSGPCPACLASYSWLKSTGIVAQRLTSHASLSAFAARRSTISCTGRIRGPVGSALRPPAIVLAVSCDYRLVSRQGLIDRRTSVRCSTRSQDERARRHASTAGPSAEVIPLRWAGRLRRGRCRKALRHYLPRCWVFRLDDRQDHTIDGCSLASEIPRDTGRFNLGYVVTLDQLHGRSPRPTVDQREHIRSEAFKSGTTRCGRQRSQRPSAGQAPSRVWAPGNSRSEQCE